jgi:seryl-tRNA synthetase
MIDLKRFRNAPQAYLEALKRKDAFGVGVELLNADTAWRAALMNVEDARAAQKQLGKPESPEDVERAKQLKSKLRRLEAQLAETESILNEVHARVPNPPDSTAADGLSEEDAEVIRVVGQPPQFPFPPRDHLALGEIDMERAAKVSGSRFAYRLGDTALAELALYRFALDRLVGKGFTPVLPPVLVLEKAMYGTGFLPTDEVNLYRIERDDLYLTGTSEVALAAMHMEEKLAADELPLRYAGYSTCFRREAGAAGKDTRGMFRVHQFDKVEMFVFCLPEHSREEHERLLAIEEELVGELGIPYRVMNIAAGDLGASAAKKYDIEAWFPSQQRYREITSTSNTTDYQARRLNVRFRREDGNLEPVHTLNGTAVTARLLLAIMENFQDEEGSYEIPSVLEQFGAPQKGSTGPG